MREVDMYVQESEVKFCYGMSKMVVTDECATYKKYTELAFVEFLEFLGRLAHVKFLDSSESLAWKLEQVLDEILPHYGMKRIEVNLDVNELSQSDEDY